LNGYRNDHFNAWVFVSDDYGTTWKQLFTDLPAEPVNVLREDPKNENLLYVGTDHGLYVSVDGGASSMAWMSELPRVAIHDIAIQERENEIVLGTHGRGIYIASLSEAQKLAGDKAYYEKKKSEVK
jgi:ligand-binding sensor domain-containing protein